MPLNANRIRSMINRALNQAEISRLWTGLRQECVPSKRSGEKTYRSVLKIKDLKTLLDTFPKYVADYKIPQSIINLNEKKGIEEYGT